MLKATPIRSQSILIGCCAIWRMKSAVAIGCTPGIGCGTAVSDGACACACVFAFVYAKKWTNDGRRKALETDPLLKMVSKFLV